MFGRFGQYFQKRIQTCIFLTRLKCFLICHFRSKEQSSDSESTEKENEKGGPQLCDIDFSVPTSVKRKAAYVPRGRTPVKKFVPEVSIHTRCNERNRTFYKYLQTEFRSPDNVSWQLSNKYNFTQDSDNIYGKLHDVAWWFQ